MPAAAQQIAQKAEAWLADALSVVAADNRLPIYTGEDSEGDRKRPSIAIVCEDSQVTEPFLYEDNERTVTISVYLSSQADDKISLHASRCAALEAVLQDQAGVVALYANIPNFFVYRYNVTRADTQKDDATRTRSTIYTITAICRDDNGDGTTT